MPVTIPNGSKHMNVVTYTGNGTARTITGVGFQPDFVWIKNRTSGAFWHQLYDVNRGALKSLFSNDTSAESTYTDTLTAFTSDGFTLGTDTIFNGGVNKSGDSYVAWCWKAGGAAVTNTAGSISAQVSANTTSGFSVVTYTGTGSAATVGHGLGVAPRFIITKRRDSSASGGNWYCYHTSLGTSLTLVLNGTNAQISTANSYQSVSSSNYGIGTNGDMNTSSGTFVAYCWSEVAGFSKFGSYTGNGSADGPFVFTGFRPKFVMIKQTSGLSDWWIWDTARQTFNQINAPLYPNTSSAESSNAAFNFDILSNGFKMRSTNPTVNGNGLNYIYMAFAENPTKYALGR